MKPDQAQRKKLLRGERVTFEIEDRDNCPEGELVLERFGQAPIVTLRWMGPVRDHGKWFATYTVVDLRPQRLLRSTPPATRFNRHQRSDPTAEALETAAEESSYTRNPHQAMTEEPEAVPKDYQDRLSREASAGNAMKREVERVRAEKLRLERRLIDAKREGKDRTVKTIRRRLDSANRQLDEAA